ncbi:F-box domain cyclin-like protein [Neofusicoccum parvum]|nr:F-box domain cyclin-like protein [Neofusicoccum parvum]
MAVSSAHEQSEVEARGREVSDGSRGRFTLRQYNKAIARLSEQPYGGPQPSRTLLLTCVLFVCLEFLRGDTNMAMTHTLNGLNILSTWQADVAQQKLHGYSDYQRKDEDFITENLAPVFCRLSVISTLLGKPTPIVRATPPAMDGSGSPPHGVARGSFRTLNEARDALVDIQNSGLRFMWATMEKKYQGAIAMTEILEQVRLEMRLAEWHRALEELETQLAKRPKAQLAAAAVQAEEDSLIILRLLYFVAHIWLSSCLSLKESAFDAFISEFQQINHLSARLLSRRRPSPSSSSSSTAPYPTPTGTFSFDTEIVGPLYFTAIKCREPTTRRQTLALLEQCNKREGAIDSRRASQLATAIMQIEEAGLQLAAENPQPAHRQQPHHPPSSSSSTARNNHNTSSPPSHLPPDTTRAAHVVGLPTTFTDAAAVTRTPPPSAAHAANTAARLPAEGNRVMAYYEPVMLPSAQALPLGVQLATPGRGLAYRTAQGVFRRADAFAGAGRGGRDVGAREVEEEGRSVTGGVDAAAFGAGGFWAQEGREGQHYQQQQHQQHQHRHPRDFYG